VKKQAFLLALLALTLVSCAGVYGPKGNDVGGIILGRRKTSRTLSQSPRTIAADTINTR